MRCAILARLLKLLKNFGPQQKSLHSPTLEDFSIEIKHALRNIVRVNTAFFTMEHLVMVKGLSDPFLAMKEQINPES